MPDKVFPGPIDDELRTSFREAVSIHTNKIFDSCKDKDCIEDLRMYPTMESQTAIENAVSIRPRSAELLYVGIDVEEVAFNRGFYTVDMRFFYRVTGDAYTLVSRSNEISGLCIFDKRVILFGSEGNAKIFSSNMVPGAVDTQLPVQAKLPSAYVEAVDPIILGMRLTETCDIPGESDVIEVPDFISGFFTSPLVLDNGTKRVLVSLGQFSIVRLERDSQLLIPSYDYCVPCKECGGASEDDPCSMFSKINFPVDEFFPPNTQRTPDGYREAIANLTR